MAKIERDPAFTATGIRVLPIVMNTAAQITPDMTRLGVTTPFLLDDGTTSTAYDTLGKGMHEGLPGHGFVLIDAQGVQKWSCLLYTSDAADDLTRVDLGGRRIIKKKK